MFKQKTGAPMSDIVKSYIGILAQGKHTFASVENLSGDLFFKEAMGLKKGHLPKPRYAPDSRKMRQPCFPSLTEAISTFWSREKCLLPPLWTGHIPFDADVTPHDNSKNQKEHVSHAYKGMDGYAPIACYLGQEGWAIGYELRAGSQHSQCEFIYTLDATLMPSIAS